jgi:hypothetical protein
MAQRVLVAGDSPSPGSMRRRARGGDSLSTERTRHAHQKIQNRRNIAQTVCTDAVLQVTKSRLQVFCAPLPQISSQQRHCCLSTPSDNACFLCTPCMLYAAHAHFLRAKLRSSVRWTACASAASNSGTRRYQGQMDACATARHRSPYPASTMSMRHTLSTL